MQCIPCRWATDHGIFNIQRKSPEHKMILQSADVTISQELAVYTYHCLYAMSSWSPNLCGNLQCPILDYSAQQFAWILIPSYPILILKKAENTISSFSSNIQFRWSLSHVSVYFPSIIAFCIVTFISHVTASTPMLILVLGPKGSLPY